MAGVGAGEGSFFKLAQTNSIRRDCGTLASSSTIATFWLLGLETSLSLSLDDETAQLLAHASPSVAYACRTFGPRPSLL